MNTDVINTDQVAIDLPIEEKINVNPDENSEMIWQKRPKPKQFTAADLWNIRKNGRTFKGLLRIRIR